MATFVASGDRANSRKTFHDGKSCLAKLILARRLRLCANSDSDIRDCGEWVNHCRNYRRPVGMTKRSPVIVPMSYVRRLAQQDEREPEPLRRPSKSMSDLCQLDDAEMDDDGRQDEDDDRPSGDRRSRAVACDSDDEDVGEGATAGPSHSSRGAQGATSSATPHSSPSHHEPRTYWRRKGHQITSWWSNLKKFAPQRRARSRSKDRSKSAGSDGSGGGGGGRDASSGSGGKRKKQHKDGAGNVGGNRLSNSHPDVSRMLEGYVEAFKEGSHSASASLTSSPKRMLELPATPAGSPFLGCGRRPRRPSSTGASSAATDTVSTTGRLSAEPGSVAEHSGARDHVDGELMMPPAGEDGFADTADGTILRQRHGILRQHPFFELDIWLKTGQDLIAKDSCGTSDPYVKFKMAGKLLFKSKTVHKNLNPEWNERFVIPVEDVFQPIQIKVFDYDWGLHDDFMGASSFDLSSLELYQPTDVTLGLAEPGKSESLGSVNLVFTLIPRSQEDKEQYFHRNVRLSDTNKKLKSQIWSSVVTIVLVEGKNLGVSPLSAGASCASPSSTNRDETSLCPGIKFHLGNGKYKAKCAQRTCNPQWREQFDLHLFDDQDKILFITVYDGSRFREEVIGRCRIDLTQLEAEKTHRLWKDLQEGNGSILLLLTISGTTNETISDLANYELSTRERDALIKKYSPWKTLQNLKDIGHLTVKVFKAQGLASADLGGKSDPFCVLELVNARLQTQTEYKTLSPSWQKIFTFNVKDIHSVLELTVFDEDRDHKVEFLGKIEIPLLKIKNGEKKWYLLKDKKLHGRAKGQILLEMEVVYNPLRACVRTFNPQEEKYMEQEEKFKRQVFINNVMRVKTMIMVFIDLANYIQSCWEWESPVRSCVSFAVFLIVTYHFELYMLPIVAFIIFLRSTVLKPAPKPHEEEEDDGYIDDDDDDDKDKEEKKSLKEKLQAIQEVALTVQVALGKVASVWESIKNTFNFSVPFLSWLAIIVLTVAMVLLYFVPLRLIVMLWGVNKFTKKLRSPHAIPNNEVLDFLSRVPDDEHLVMQKELRPSSQSDTEKKGHKKKKSS